MNRCAALRAVLRVLLAVCAGATAACSVLGPSSPTETDARPAETAARPAEHESPTEPETVRESERPAGRSASVELEAPDERARPARPEPGSARVVVIASSDASSYREVADALDAAVTPEYELEHVSLGTGFEPRDLASEPRPVAAVAIGMEAVELASRELSVPIVFCQVFDHDRALAAAPAVYGVAALPPLGMQLRAWTDLAGELADIGVIVGPGHDTLVADARASARDAGLELHVRHASSDREALYMFRRLVPDIDGLWLFPDNDILSPGVIRSMLEYGAEHDVQSLVFNASLLDWGAYVSMRPRPNNVAATVAHVLHAAARGRHDDLPAVTPLTDIEVRVNEELVPLPRLSIAPPDGVRGVR